MTRCSRAISGSFVCFCASLATASVTHERATSKPCSPKRNRSLPRLVGLSWMATVSNNSTFGGSSSSDASLVVSSTMEELPQTALLATALGHGHRHQLHGQHAQLQPSARPQRQALSHRRQLSFTTWLRETQVAYHGVHRRIVLTGVAAWILMPPWQILVCFTLVMRVKRLWRVARAVASRDPGVCRLGFTLQSPVLMIFGNVGGPWF